MIRYSPERNGVCTIPIEGLLANRLNALGLGVLGVANHIEHQVGVVFLGIGMAAHHGEVAVVEGVVAAGKFKQRGYAFVTSGDRGGSAEELPHARLSVKSNGYKVF